MSKRFRRKIEKTNLHNKQCSGKSVNLSAPIGEVARSVEGELTHRRKNKSLRREDVKTISSLTNLGLAKFPRPLWERVRERGTRRSDHRAEAEGACNNFNLSGGLCCKHESRPTRGGQDTGHTATNQSTTPRPTHSVGQSPKNLIEDKLSNTHVMLNLFQHLAFNRSRNKFGMTYSKKAAFTLAEVLITLGIIGVISALLIPRFTEKVYKNMWANQLISTHAKLQQGFRQMMADDGTDNIKSTEVFQSIGGDGVCDTTMDPDGDECKDFFTNLRKYFKISDIKLNNYKNEIRSLSGDGNPLLFIGEPVGLSFDSSWINHSIYLHDGTEILGYRFSKNVPTLDLDPALAASFIVVDINGEDKPNKTGRDIFTFTLAENGMLLPFWSKASIKEHVRIFAIAFDPSILEFLDPFADDVWRQIGMDSQTCHYYAPMGESTECSGGMCGMGCAAKVLEDKAMKY